MAAQPDKKTVIKDLLELGKSKGQLSTKEILDALGELDFDPEQIEKFYDTLESQGVELSLIHICTTTTGARPCAWQSSARRVPKRVCALLPPMWTIPAST